MPKPLWGIEAIGIFNLKPHLLKKIASKAISVYVERKTNLGTQISSICVPVSWKLKKEIVWNKVKFATYPSVWPAIPLDTAFNHLQ